MGSPTSPPLGRGSDAVGDRRPQNLLGLTQPARRAISRLGLVDIGGDRALKGRRCYTTNCVHAETRSLRQNVDRRSNVRRRESGARHRYSCRLLNLSNLSETRIFSCCYLTPHIAVRALRTSVTIYVQLELLLLIKNQTPKSAAWFLGRIASII